MTNEVSGCDRTSPFALVFLDLLLSSTSLYLRISASLRSERISLHLLILSSVAFLELGDTIDGHSPTTFFVYLFLLEILVMYIACLGLYRGFCASLVYIREIGCVGKALLMLMEACHFVQL
jgi:hypothetical protein